MNTRNIIKMVNEEVDNMFMEAQKNSEKIEKELDTLRKKLFKDEELTRGNLGESTPRLFKKLDLYMVAELIDYPVNELMLYFLNVIKTKNERSLVELHSGIVYFYAI